jgi:hypothetical protein
MVESTSGKANGGLKFAVANVGGLLVLLVLCAIGIAFGTFQSVLPIYRAVQSRSWRAASCEVLSSRVVRSMGIERRRRVTFRPDIQYRYHIDDRGYTGNLYNFVPGSDSFSGYQSVVEQYPPGRRFECYVNPADPTQAVINRDVTSGYFFGVFVFLFLTGTSGALILVWARAAKVIRHAAR